MNSNKWFIGLLCWLSKIKYLECFINFELLYKCYFCNENSNNSNGLFYYVENVFYWKSLSGGWYLRRGNLG